MKAIFVLTLCMLVMWTTMQTPEQAGATTERGPVACAAGADGMPGADGPDQAVVGAIAGVAGGAVWSSALTEARGGWWNWVLKILRAILDVLPGGDDDPAEDPQT